MKLIYFKHNKQNPMGRIKHEKIYYYDLTFLLEGTMHWKINGKAYTVNAGDVFLIQSNSFREREPFEHCNYYSFNFFSDEKITLPPLIEGGITKELQMLLSSCDDIQKSVLDYWRPLEYVLLSMLSILQSNLNTNKMPRLVQTIKSYIAQHIHEPISLEEVASCTFFSAVYCSSVFKRETGQSIIDYVLDEKVNLAKRYILEGLPLRQVAECLGFSDYNYFSRMFKKRAKVTPIQYKHSLVRTK